MASKAPKKKPASKKPAAKASKVERLPARAGVGHNGKVNKPLLAIFDSYAKMDNDKKQIGKAQRDLRAKAKEEHGVDKDVFGHEVKLRKMDSARRATFEQGHSDLRGALGYQFSLGLVNQPGDDQEEGDEGEALDPEEAAAAAASA